MWCCASPRKVYADTASPGELNQPAPVLCKVLSSGLPEQQGHAWLKSAPVPGMKVSHVDEVQDEDFSLCYVLFGDFRARLFSGPFSISFFPCGNTSLPKEPVCGSMLALVIVQV